MITFILNFKKMSNRNILLVEMDWLNVGGFFLSLIGLAGTIIQTYRAKQVSEDLKQKKREQNASIWCNISMVLNTYDTLEDARIYANGASGPENMDALSAKISSARRCIVDQYLNLLKQAVLDEPDFSEEVLQRWIKQGRLENEWRVAQARKLIQRF